MYVRVLLDTLQISKSVEVYLKHLQELGVAFDMLVWYMIEAAVTKDQSDLDRKIRIHLAQVVKTNHREQVEDIFQLVQDCIADALPKINFFLDRFLGEYRLSAKVECYLGRDIILKVYVPETITNDNNDPTAPTGRSSTEGLQCPDAGESTSGLSAAAGNLDSHLGTGSGPDQGMHRTPSLYQRPDPDEGGRGRD